ncbi:NAD(P)H-hydrate dehydratase [Azomonas macrocytogenes]|uniref:Bifunctional NAD(P)H-hydrate repair enzyme n=1 Tax=Azomonas macrocytogenes TaxID=69962 RepID=A0A839T392_AZOMA|nr:NAD(P)H-hydrate dehydratase [Azomonas macrocytogenes]MBB3102435.1 NAD(P)H-hydrate epimerase [Azomonas macrocytogenes]
MLQTTADLPLALYTAAQIRELDTRLIAAGIPGFELMHRAGSTAWRHLQKRWPEAAQMTVLAGRGNNAGDGFLIAALAWRAGWQVRVLTVGEPYMLQSDAALAHDDAASIGVPIEPWRPGAPLQGILVDALLGTGLSGDVFSPYAEAIQAINDSGLPVLAVDLPSGLCANTGRVLGKAVCADLTVTFIGLKLGLFTGEGPTRAGELIFDDLQADSAVMGQIAFDAVRLTLKNLPLLAPRSRTAHKSQFGRLLIIGGDFGTGGAALMAAQAGLRTGAGMVTLITRPEHVAAALMRQPEIMCMGVESTFELDSLKDSASVLVVGPGLGLRSWGRSLLTLANQCRIPQVWDADALNLLANGAVTLPPDCLITPHPGEAARLLGCSIDDVQNDRPGAVHALAARYSCVALLKGAGTLIAAPDGRLVLCDRGHPAMASAGLGDVLAGVTGALLAQGMAVFDAACLGAWLHAVAGEHAGVQGRGLAACDLIPLIRQILEEHSPCLR